MTPQSLETSGEEAFRQWRDPGPPPPPASTRSRRQGVEAPEDLGRSGGEVGFRSRTSGSDLPLSPVLRGGWGGGGSPAAPLGPPFHFWPSSVLPPSTPRFPPWVLRWERSSPGRSRVRGGPGLPADLPRTPKAEGPRRPPPAAPTSSDPPRVGPLPLPSYEAGRGGAVGALHPLHWRGTLLGGITGVIRGMTCDGINGRAPRWPQSPRALGAVRSPGASVSRPG